MTLIEKILRLAELDGQVPLKNYVARGELWGRTIGSYRLVVNPHDLEVDEIEPYMGKVFYVGLDLPIGFIDFPAHQTAFLWSGLEGFESAVDDELGVEV